MITKPPLNSCNVTDYITEMINWYKKTNIEVGRDDELITWEWNTNIDEISERNVSRVIASGKEKTNELVSGSRVSASSKEKTNELVNMLKRTENGNLFSLILKQKDKISDLKIQLAEPDLPSMVISHIAFLAKALVEKEMKLKECEIKSREDKQEIAELKRIKKRNEEQISTEKADMASKNISTLHKQVEILRAEKQQLREEIKELECKTTAFDDLKDENAKLNRQVADLSKENVLLTNNEKQLSAKVEVLKSAAKDIEQDEISRLQAENAKIARKIDSLNKDKTVLNDKLEEFRVKYENIDKFYNTIVANKDKTIEKYIEITEMPHDSDNKLRRLLAYHKAEKELAAMVRLKEVLQEGDGGEIGDSHDSLRGVMSGKDDLGTDSSTNNINSTRTQHVGMQPDSKLMEYINSRETVEAGERIVTDGEVKKACWFGSLCFRAECKFGHSATLAAPNCRFKMRCNRKDCVFSHPDDCTSRVGCLVEGCGKRHIIGHVTKTDIMGETKNENERSESVQCRYGLQCSRSSCVFKHANDCRNRRDCQLNDCERRHIQDGHNNQQFFPLPNYSKQANMLNNVPSFTNNKNAGLCGMDYGVMSANMFPFLPGFPFPGPAMANQMNVPGIYSKNMMCR